MNDFIPAGRTSMVKKDGVTVQIQTEYAVRPYPRVSTTILNSGKVIHKIEKKLDNPIQSVEEQNKIEDFIRHQHGEVVATIQKSSENHTFSENKSVKDIEKRVSSSISDKFDNTDDPAVDDEPKTIYDRLKALPGVQRIFQLDNEGNFIGQDDSENFQKHFGSILKNLKDVMDIFMLMPETLHREKGVYEVHPDRLYYVSYGTECFFIAVRRTDGTTIYEKAIKEAIKDPGELTFS